MKPKTNLGAIVEGWSSRPQPSHTKIIGKYCVLEPLDIKKHSADLFAAFLLNNESGETWQYMPFGPFTTLGAFEEWLVSSINSYNLVYAVINPKTNKPEGVASFMNAQTDHGSIEVGGIHYAKQLQKTRAATEAMYLMMYRIFEELGYRRYEWKCNALNEPSRNAAIRLGFKFEGIFRQHWVAKGRNRDTAWFSIIDSEWPELKRRFETWLDKNNFDVAGKQIKKLQEC
jgi:RimJ/RimL family protein N-acetyltransferase